jgi:hypothetical protein
MDILPLSNIIPYLDFEDAVALGSTCHTLKSMLEKPHFISLIKDSKHYYYHLFNGPPPIGKKIFICNQHPELTKTTYNSPDDIHKFMVMGCCTYCAMSGNSPFVNPFSFNLDIIKHGYQDYHRQIDFRPVNASNVYKFGYELAKHGIPKETIDLLQT